MSARTFRNEGLLVDLSKLENGRCCNPGRIFLQHLVAAYGLLGRPLTPEQRGLIANAVLARAEAA